MIDNVLEKNCVGCMSCKDVCPKEAIGYTTDKMGFSYPHIDISNCIKCNICESVCPIIKNTNLLNDKENNILRAYACYNKSYNERANSTSGGIFLLLSKITIDDNGIVYGAAYKETENGRIKVVHKRADKIEKAMEFCGSKYVQSDMKDIYIQIEKDLIEGKKVLFSGLPCQVEALRTFLKKEYEKLTLIDLVCFGIGSPGIFADYLDEYYSEKKILNIEFKNKVTGWKNWKVKIELENNGSKEKEIVYFDKYKNLYMNSYIKRINMRESCYNCRFKGLNRNSDMTIGDCWGIGEKNKNLNDDKGLSAVLVHSKKGETIFSQIIENLHYKEYDARELMEGNSAMIMSPFKPVERIGFEREYYNNGIKSALETYCGFTEK
jgi:coenzyme F420-reducing hydrogenase beta subunit